MYINIGTFGLDKKILSCTVLESINLVLMVQIEKVHREAAHWACKFGKIPVILSRCL